MASKNNHAFTIVELLVVIVVIGILAAISIVAYTGISQKAVISSLQSDLSSASKQLKLFYTDNAHYPLTISTNCSSVSDSDTNKCLGHSPGNTYTYTPGSGTNPTTYILSATSNGLNYAITNDSKPIAAAPNSPVADWLAIPQGDHYGNYYDMINKQFATVTRTTPKTIYDPSTQHIYDVPAGYLGIRPRTDNKNGTEAEIEEARTNYLLNSSFEDNTMTGWSFQYPANGSASLTTEKLVHGGYSLKITRTVANSEANVYNIISGLENSTVYSYSAWAWADTSNTACIYTYAGSANPSPVCHSGSGKWERLVASFTSSTTGSIQLRLVHTNSSPNLNSVYFDAVQVEKGAFATSYIPTMTAAVTRNADKVTIPTTNWNPAAGTILGVEYKTTNASYLLLNSGTTSNKNILVMYNESATTCTNWFYGADATLAVASKTCPAANSGYMTFGTTWSSDGLLVYINGSPGTLTATDTNDGLNAVSYIGSNSSGGASMNGPVQRMVIYSSSLSSSDVMVATNAIKDGPQ